MMARAIGRLTALKIQKAKEPGMYADGGGLYLRVTPEGARNWVLRFMLDRRPRWMGLGPLKLYGLAEARAKALDARRKYRPEISTLLRDAQPLAKGLEGESDKQSKKDAERRRDIATDELIKLYRHAENMAQLSPTDRLCVRVFCEQLKRRNGGKLPLPRGGRPGNDHEQMLIAVKVEETLAAQRGNRKNVTLAIKQVHDTLAIDGKRFFVPTSRIRDIHYRYRSDPERKRALRAELARLALERGKS
jgi:hypothetical protein